MAEQALTAAQGDVPVALFSFALAIEKTMAWVYRTASGLTPIEEAREVLNALASAEDGHGRLLAESYPDLAALAGEADEPSKWTISRFLREVIPTLDLTDLRSLLVSAYRIEHGGGEMYRYWSERASTEAGRELASRLAHLEVAHKRAVAEQFRLAFGTEVEDEEGALEPLTWPEWR